ncbi:MAG: hypothetical protein IJX17_04925 [Clostridia bacterium]|nr:hypothetical protein [Clostridia bacterium]
MNKYIKNIYKHVKNLCETINSFEDLHKKLDEEFERISNRKDKSYNSEYSIVDIFKAKTIKEFEVEKPKKSDTGIVVEFVKYEKAPQGFLFIYNVFIDGIQEHIDIYILKKDKEYIF